jgi:hypothetical protein
MMNLILRRALKAVALTAAAAAGSYIARQLVERQRVSSRSRRDDRADVHRWEDEGGSPPDLKAAVPHHEVAVR